MAHDFKKFPELTNNQMQFYYFDSPHTQINEGFIADVVQVHDGDTIKVRTSFRNFDFPIRMSGIAAPELKEVGGIQSRDWLSNRVLGKEIYVFVDPANRVGKYGRLIGEVILGGASIGEESMMLGKSEVFG